MTNTRTYSGAALKRRREQLGFVDLRDLSQAEVAARTGGLLSQKQISALELGVQSVSSLSVVRANALAAALRWTPWELQQATGESLLVPAPDVPDVPVPPLRRSTDRHAYQ